MDDSIIIKSIKNKDEIGIELLLKSYGGLIKSIVKHHLKDISFYEEECINDILFSIWNNISLFNETGSFKNWVAIISKFKSIDYKRKYLKLNSILDIDEIDISDNKGSVEEIVIYNEFKEEVKELLSNLKNIDKELFIKYYLENKNIIDISREMNMKSYQIYNRLSRGRKKLSSILKEIY
ncbi:sigma-70 family RNA polymerase sigma factor [Clostridium sp.]|uniref:sigma-70 family RNA polymerase sigma factor n=1 Tax=Clostridium sp. TaxID=1506 RepID=UPI002910E265|nr:sigma-70 family RNA polymerase sigma factor [Clostridium sp.]MDU5107871.1 sigma-70 family RNA polymerase sigma factor [Clostridium sp.]